VSRFSNIVSKIDALSPLKVLNRGYAIVSKGNIIKTINDTMVGDNIKIRLSDGILGALITEKEKEYGKKD
jgi:exodeoxyribonuclease VII large subunit